MAPLRKPVVLNLPALPELQDLNRSVKWIRQKADNPRNHVSNHEVRWQNLLGDGDAITLFKEMEGKIRQLRLGYHQSLHKSIADCVVIARHLENKAREWDAFCSMPSWAGVRAQPKNGQRPEGLRFVLRWACGVDPGGSKRASFYHRAITGLLGAGTDPHDLPAAIKARGGLRKLASPGKASEAIEADKFEDGGLVDDEPSKPGKPKASDRMPDKTRSGKVGSKPSGGGSDSEPPVPTEDGEFSIIGSLGEGAGSFLKLNRGERVRLSIEVLKMDKRSAKIMVLEVLP